VPKPYSFLRPLRLQLHLLLSRLQDLLSSWILYHHLLELQQDALLLQHHDSGAAAVSRQSNHLRLIFVSKLLLTLH
jgi:hypothetical protein